MAFPSGMFDLPLGKLPPLENCSKKVNVLVLNLFGYAIVKNNNGIK